MTKRIVQAVAAAALLSAAGCVKEISSDERLERETTRADAMKTSTAEELTKLKCDDVNAELVKARDESRSEEQRLNSYVDLYLKVKERTAKFDEAITRNPDLAYQEGSEEITGAREGCIQSQADVRLDLENLVREVMQMPTVDEIKGGSTVKVARMSFDTLRDAIETLELDDKEALFTKLSNAEKALETKPPPGGKRRREK
ncbi:MAG: hypothetical protein AMXMBFR34_29910 [Myxococcaceae bacterium]